MTRRRLLFVVSLCICLLLSGPPQAEERSGPDKEGRPNQSINLGAGVNSPFSDFGPIISPDGDALYFTSDRPGGRGGQDVWVSYRRNGAWQKAVNLGAPINTAGDEGPDSFSLSENALYFTASNREFGYGGTDIWVSFKIKGKWSRPENLGPPINTEYNESNASISSNGDFIIFTSDRPGGMGGADLWISRRGEMIKRLMPGFATTGRWEEPTNLGPNVNTPDWEGVGFLMPDNQTLYFSSTGRGGLGGADIFRSIFKNGEWGPAENMGDLINTPGDDIYFTLPASGDLAYFASDMSGGLGREDIYSIPIPLLIPRAQLMVVKGTVKDKTSGKPVAAAVKVTDPATSRMIAVLETNPLTGEFQVVVQIPRVQIEVQAANYQTYSDIFEISPSQELGLVKKEILLIKK